MKGIKALNKSHKISQVELNDKYVIMLNIYLFFLFVTRYKHNSPIKNICDV